MSKNTTNTDYLVNGKYAIEDLVDLDMLKDLFEKFSEATGFTIGFLNHPDMDILLGINWRDICSKFHRGCPASNAVCIESNRHLLDQLNEPGKLVIEYCENGLVDCAIPIIIQGKHVASLATGQLLFKEPDLEKFRQQAKKFGFDEDQYMKALEDIPVLDEQKVRNMTAFLGKLSEVISKLGYTNLLVIEDAKRMNEVAVLKAAAEVEQRKAKELFEASRKLKEAEEQLIQAEKMASVGQLGAGVAHELNSPLAGVLSLLRAHKKKKDRNSIEYEDLTDMEEACVHMARIIKGLNRFTRASQGDSEELDVNEVIETTLGFGSACFTEKAIKIEKDYENNLAKIRVVKSQLQQVIMNIISNANDAMQDKGTFKISTGNCSLNGKNSVEMKFSDNGTGIKEENLKKIFDPFFTTKRPGGGVGLGMSISYKIIEVYKGSITVESCEGKGSVFTVRIPVI